jgi:hydroxymethylpyrimidine/phosphomethylpyrimidine kinase
VATSGDALNEQGTTAAMQRLLDLATIVTPNLAELDALGGEAAILEHGCALLVKGGHGDGDVVTDRLVTRQGKIARWSLPRIDTKHTHGTGCTLASAIATGLGQGMSMEDAVGRAIHFVRAAIVAAPSLGQGHGPMGHALGVVPFDAIQGDRA